jgi:transcription initiation factor TFIID subunit TAF12
MVRTSGLEVANTSITTAYENAYRRAWEAQNREDSMRNELVLGSSEHLSRMTARSRARSKARQLKKEQQLNRDLSERAAAINNMLNFGFTPDATAELLGISTRIVVENQRKYGLPREKDESDAV